MGTMICDPKTWRQTDHPGEDYDLAVGPRGPWLDREPLRSERELGLEPLSSFQPHPLPLRVRGTLHECGCSDEERAHCKHQC
jgi:hypothetical protein